MTLQQSTVDHPVASSHDLLRIAVVIAAVVGLMIALTVVVGVQTTGPSYEIVPDPAGLAVPF